MRRHVPCLTIVLIAVPLVFAGTGHAKDYFLTIGGGYAPSGNQVSLEKNVLYFQRVLETCELRANPCAVLFADGDGAADDLQVIDPQAVPEVNRLMAEFFGSRRDLGLYYRNHQIPGVRDKTSPETIRDWFDTVGANMQSGDRLVLYVAAHGGSSRDRQDPFNTSILLWNRQRLDVRALVELLDGLPQGVSVVTVMVQCHSGGFARCIFNAADPDRGLATQRRCGFFATVHDRPAAGCTPEIDEATYKEYSTYFWEALSGIDRLGSSVQRPDYDGDSRVSFEEAHAYTVLHSDTIDLPIKTSGEFLRQHSRLGDQGDHLLGDDVIWKELLQHAAAPQRAVLEGLADELELTSQQRLQEARQRLEAQSDRRNRSRSRGRGEPSLAIKLRQKIAADLQRRWPELVNVLNPRAIELVTERSETFVAAVREHPDFDRYRQELRRDAEKPNPKKQRVRIERFVRTAENVLLAENLRREGDQALIEHYESIVAAERGTLGNDTDSPQVAALAE